MRTVIVTRMTEDQWQSDAELAVSAEWDVPGLDSRERGMGEGF